MTLNSKTHIVWATNVDPSGYSSCARSYVKALYENPKCDVSIIINNVARNINLHGIDKSDILFFSDISTKYATSDQLLVQHCVPDRFVFGSKPHIIYTVTEMPCPDRWSFICNKCDLIMTASHFCKEQMINSGIKEEIIHVVPHCHDFKQWNPSVTPLNIENLRGVNFLFLGDYTPRKGGDDVVRQFIKVFSGNKDVSLTIKAYFNSFSFVDQKRLIDRIESVSISSGVERKLWPKIMFYGEPIRETLMPRFMASFDCLVSPHRDEGWGLSLSEMLCLGKPVIATGYSGNLEFMNKENSFLIDIDGFEPVCDEMVAINPNFIGCSWPKVNLDMFSDLMSHVVSDVAGSLEKGNLAYREMCELFNFNIISNRIINVVEGV